MSFIQNLFNLIQGNPLKEKILIAKSHSQGLQWMERMSRELGPVTNVTVQTIGEFIYDYGKLAFIRSKRNYCRRERPTGWCIRGREGSH